MSELRFLRLRSESSRVTLIGIGRNDLGMIEQKLDYIHHNPVRGKWSLTDDFTKFSHSSAVLKKWACRVDAL